MKKEVLAVPSLEGPAKTHDLDNKRHMPGQGHNKLRNKAYLLSIILDGEGKGFVVPPLGEFPLTFSHCLTKES